MVRDNYQPGLSIALRCFNTSVPREGPNCPRALRPWLPTTGMRDEDRISSGLTSPPHRYLHIYMPGTLHRRERLEAKRAVSIGSFNKCATFAGVSSKYATAKGGTHSANSRYCGRIQEDSHEKWIKTAFTQLSPSCVPGPPSSDNVFACHWAAYCWQSTYCCQPNGSHLRPSSHYFEFAARRDVSRSWVF